MHKKELLKTAKPLIVNREVAKLLPQKTMTRRVIKQDFSCPFKDWEDAYIDAYNHGNNWYWRSKDNKICVDKVAKAQYNIGDILWIREPVQIIDYHIGKHINRVTFQYTDGKQNTIVMPDRISNTDLPKWLINKQFVPNGCLKEMARYFVKIINIRVERLWDIAKYYDDYYKEGIAELAKEDIKQCNGEIYCINKCLEFYFKKLWNKTAPKGYKWEDNPFVFVYEWEYLERRIDEKNKR